VTSYKYFLNKVYVLVRQPSYDGMGYDVHTRNAQLFKL